MILITVNLRLVSLMMNLVGWIILLSLVMIQVSLVIIPIRIPPVDKFMRIQIPEGITYHPFNNQQNTVINLCIIHSMNQIKKLFPSRWNNNNNNINNNSSMIIMIF